MFCARLGRAAFTPPYEIRELIHQCDEIGSKSLPLVALAGAATGVVLSLQTRDSLIHFGAKSLLPAVIFYSVVKESGPVITGLVVSGRVGAGIGAELGSMRVTEQIDAMEASAVEPFRYLVATRVLACILMLPLLTLCADFCAIMMGWIAETVADPITFRHFVGERHERRPVPRLHSAHAENARLWVHHRARCLLPGNAHDRRYRRRRALDHQFGSAFLALRDSRGRDPRAADSGLLWVRHYGRQP